MKYIRFLVIVLFAATFLTPAINATAQENQTGRQHFEQGVAAYNERDYKTAIEQFHEAIKRDPSLEADVHLYIGRIAIQNKRWGLAAEELLRAKKMGLSEERKREANIALAYVLAYGEFPQRPVRKVEKPLNFHLTISEEWVDGLALPLTVSTAFVPIRSDDFRTKIAAGLDYRLPVGQKGKLTTGYYFFQSLYADFNNLNFQSHTLSGRYNHEATKDVNLSANIGFTYNRLDGNDFMNLFNISPGVFFREKGSFFGKVVYNYANLDYKLNPGQDSDIHTLSFTQYYFLPNKKDFIAAGYAYANTDATLKRWDFNLHRGFISGKHEFNPKNRVTGSLSYSSYDYQGFDTLETTKKRQDNIFSLNVRYTYEFRDMADIFVRYFYLNNDSNLARQDYDSNVIAAGIALDF